MKRLIYTVIMVLFPAVSFAQVDLGGVIKSNEGEPINITSENLIIKNAENLSVFENNVHVTQGNMNLRANQMKVYSEITPGTNKSSFKKIEAIGNVDFRADDKTAKSEHAVYDVKAGLLTLTDNVRLTDADTVLQGRVFEYNVKTKLSKVSNSGGTISASSKGSGAAGNDSPAENPKPSSGRSKVIFTPGEGIKSFGMPMDAFEGMHGKARDPEEKKKEEEKPKP
jgi:lipopolysaccharide export system protein LptA